MLKVTLKYDGALADEHLLDFYDTSQALLGFQRTLALTTHLIINGEIITQVPSLKGANILVGALEEGSLKIPAYISSIALGAYALGSLESTNPLGHLIYSAYDYVVSESLGVHVNYDESLGESYAKLRKSQQNQLPLLEESKLDALIEKCESGIIAMHRPLIASKTATRAYVTFKTAGGEQPIKGGFDHDSYEFMVDTRQDTEHSKVVGKVSSYNINTFKGRFFCTSERRPIPFELSESIRSRKYVRRITSSLSKNAVDRNGIEGDLLFDVYKNVTKSGRLKSYFVVDVHERQQQ